MGTEPLVSVVIPSRNNRDKLEITLESIARCRMELDRVEVVVVDDGSEDGTSEAFSGREYPFELRLVRGEYANQSKATNAGIREARGAFVLGSASDIVFHPDLFLQHLASHEQARGADVCVLGYLPYWDGIEVNPFMVYLVNGGPQFAFSLIEDPMRVAPNFLYAPNFSVRREILDRIAGFDESFPFGGQDSDLGIRLCRAGVRMVYNQDAVGYHNHPLELKQFFRRQEMAGDATFRLQLKHPDHMGGLFFWDTALSHYLAYSAMDMERDLAVVEVLEPRVQASGDLYRQLWHRAFAKKESMTDLPPSEVDILVATRDLFKAYERITAFYWGKGYLECGLNLWGARRVREILEARTEVGKAPFQMRRLAGRRMAAYGEKVRLTHPSEVRVTVIVHGLRTYRDAYDFLQPFGAASATVHGHELILAHTPGVFENKEVSRLEETADRVEAATEDEAVLRALERANGATVVVAHARSRPDFMRNRLLAEALFSRLTQIAVLGGPSLDDPPGGSAEIREVEVVAPDYAVFRGDALKPLLGDGGDGAWNRRLCDAARRQGRAVCCVPGFNLSAAPGSAEQGATSRAV